MKIKLFIILSGLALCFTPALSQTKHGLIFAIGDYPKESGWGVISSARDVSYIKTTLLKQGFKDDNIKTVIDAAATKQGIEKALTDLTTKVGPNDVVVIHFSSHGQQVADNNNDETDGLDETIVPYNATLPSGDYSTQEYEKIQAAYFRDDQFGAYIEQLRAKLGKNGDVVVFIDACHSGSGTRGTAKVRGGKPALMPKGYSVSNGLRKKDKETVFREGNKARGEEGALATYVVFSAARAEELNYETVGDDNVGMGSLTYAISKVFENLDAGASYRSVFSKILAIMNERVPGQVPVLEGNGIDRTLFGGNFVNQKPYIEIDAINKPLELSIRAGILSGLDQGAKVAVYPSGTIDPANAKSIALGTVIKAENYTAIINLDTDPKLAQAAAGWVFVTEPIYQIKSIKIGFEAKARSSKRFFSDHDLKLIKTSLKTLPLVSLEGQPDIVIGRGETIDTLKVAANGYVFNTIPDVSINVGLLKAEINRFAQYKFLQSLILDDPGIRAQVLLVPLINGKPDTSIVNFKNSDRTYEFKNGDKFVLWIKNPGNQDVYVNILDMQPDGVINTVIPNSQKKIYPTDLKINSGASRFFDSYPITIGPPYGTEIFKIFISTSLINMEGLATPNGTASRNNMKMLERLVKKSSDVATRGAESENIGNANGSIFNLLFEIKR